MAHRIIQIATTTETEDTTDVLYALCDDGSVWYLIDPANADENEGQWRKLPDIPQEDE